jgi:hypothetical protein
MAYLFDGLHNLPTFTPHAFAVHEIHGMSAIALIAKHFHHPKLELLP